MSTKIYYGKKLLIRDLFHLKQILESIRLENEKQTKEDIPYSLVEEEKITLHDYRDLLKDRELEFAVGFDPVTNSYYGFLMGHHGQQKLLDNIKEFQDYGYWDNVDPPEDIPEEEFDKRGEVWDRILPNYKSIGEQMFCIKLGINRYNHEI